MTKSSLTIPKPERIIMNLTFLVTDQTIGNFRHLGTRGNSNLRVAEKANIFEKKK